MWCWAEQERVQQSLQLSVSHRTLPSLHLQHRAGNKLEWWKLSRQVSLGLTLMVLHSINSFRGERPRHTPTTTWGWNTETRYQHCLNIACLKYKFVWWERIFWNTIEILRDSRLAEAVTDYSKWLSLETFSTWPGNLLVMVLLVYTWFPFSHSQSKSFLLSWYPVKSLLWKLQI